MIAIVDYGQSDSTNLANSLTVLNLPHRIATNAEALTDAEAIILPDTGNWDGAMTYLTTTGMLEAIRASNLPLLGIGRGMHLLFAENEESKLSGIDLLSGKIRQFHFKDAAVRGLKVPHSGWNSLEVSEDDPLMVDGAEVYFSHSSYVIPENKDTISAFSDYGGKFCAALRHGRIEGMQFIPEKSGSVGLQILRRWAKRVL